MTDTDYREALRLLDSALRLLDRRRHPRAIQRRVRSLSIEFDLLRARRGQPPAAWQRN
jgi:hypothetical protein